MPCFKKAVKIDHGTPAHSLPTLDPRCKEYARELIKFLDTNFKQIMGNYRWMNGVRCMPLQLVINVMNAAMFILYAEPYLVDVKSDGGQVCIFGDVHGGYRDLRRFVDLLDIDNKENKVKLVFLGDYVDRGENPIESLLYLLALKVIYPERVTLIMGNHEMTNVFYDIPASNSYHLKKDVFEMYGACLPWELVCRVLQMLPLAAIVDDSVYCAHGGIPRFSDLAQVKEKVKRMREVPHNLCNLDYFDLSDITSSDPVKSDAVIPADNPFPEGFCQSPRSRSNSLMYPCGYTNVGLSKFFEATGTSTIVRAHQHSEGYYFVQFRGKLFTVFTNTGLMSVGSTFLASIVVWNGKKFKVITLTNEEGKKRLHRHT